MVKTHGTRKEIGTNTSTMLAIKAGRILTFTYFRLVNGLLSWLLLVSLGSLKVELIRLSA